MRGVLAPQVGGAGGTSGRPLGISHVGADQVVSATGTTQAFTSAGIGAQASDKYLLVGVLWSENAGSSYSATGITVQPGGSGGTYALELLDGNNIYLNDRTHVSWWISKVPVTDADTTATIAVTGSGSTSVTCSVRVYAVTGEDAIYLVDSGRGTEADPSEFFLDLIANGISIAHANPPTGATTTWTGLTEDKEVDDDSVYMTTALDESAADSDELAVSVDPSSFTYQGAIGVTLGPVPPGHSSFRSAHFVTNDYMSRTPGTADDRTKQTISFWINCEDWSASQGWLNADSGNFQMSLLSTYFRVRNNGSEEKDTTSAWPTGEWIHVCYIFDSGQAMAADRHRLYFNQVLLPNNVTDDTITLDSESEWLSNTVHQIGAISGSAIYMKDLKVADLICLDGIVAEPSEFSEYENGVLVMKDYTGPYGSEGFHLRFDDDADLGADSSGNGNDWTLTAAPATSRKHPRHPTGVDMGFGDPVLSATFYNNGTSSAFLNRTFGSPTDRKRFAWGGWFYVEDLSAASTYILTSYGGASDAASFFFYRNSSNAIRLTGWHTSWYGSAIGVVTSSGWFHMIASMDTYQVTGAERFEIWINGSQIANTLSGPSLNQTFQGNNAVGHALGRYDYSGASAWEGGIGQFFFIDGESIQNGDFAASDFYKSEGGVLMPKDISAVPGSWGNNGALLDFADLSALGNDVSGEGNGWTANGASRQSYRLPRVV